MALVFDGPVSPQDLTSFVRLVPQPSGQILDQILPVRVVPEIEVTWSKLTRTNRVAKYRAYDGTIVTSARDSAERKRVQLPPLSSLSSVGEYERLQLEMARLGGTRESALAEAIYDDGQRQASEIYSRLELARGDVLGDGVFSLQNENGLTMSADYGVPATHLVTAGTAWSTTATATPLGDMIAWRSVYRATNGYDPGGCWISDAVYQNLLASTEVINAVAGDQTGRTRVRPDELASILAAYGLPMPSVYDARVDVDGTSTRVTPERAMIWTPPETVELGYTAMGITATALELVNSPAVEFEFSDAAGLVGVVEKQGPPYRQFVFVDAIGMPVLTDPEALFVATV